MRIPSYLSPVNFTFLTSLVLSGIALAPAYLNRDGMLYTEAAEAFLNEGLSAAASIFNWPFLSILMGLVSEVTGFSPSVSGHILNALFMAGACSLLVAITSRSISTIAWPTAFVVLALPGINEIRTDLLREYGCWFFVMLSFWFAQTWPENRQWKHLLGIQISIALATLFRPEALVFLPCLMCWQFFQTPVEGRWTRSLVFGAVPILMLIGLILAYMAGAFPETSRIARELNRFDLVSHIDTTARQMSGAFNHHARDETNSAHLILLFGSLAIVPYKLILKLGIFLIPLAYAFSAKQNRHGELRKLDIFFWGGAWHIAVLMLFVLQQQFLSGRYLAPALLFAAPVIALGCHRIRLNFPFFYKIIFPLVIILIFSNVISLKPEKDYFLDAGKWVAENINTDHRTYIDSPRVAYYAGLGFSKYRNSVHSRDGLRDQLLGGEYDLVVLEVSRKEKDLSAWLVAVGLEEIKRFQHDNGDAIVIARVLPVQGMCYCSNAACTLTE